jgi:hypothetical protein
MFISWELLTMSLSKAYASKRRRFSPVFAWPGGPVPADFVDLS